MTPHDGERRIRVLVAMDRPQWVVALGSAVADHGLPIDLVLAPAAPPVPRADVVVVDVADGGTLDSIRRLVRQEPAVRVVAVGGEDDRRSLAAVRAGASALVTPDDPPAHTAVTVVAVARGRIVVPEGWRGVLGVPTADRPLDLSDAERELLAAIARGDDNLTIGRRLFASERTVKRRVRALYERLGVSSRVEAASLAARAGLLDDTLPGPPG